MDLRLPLHVGTMVERQFPHRLSLPVPTHDGGWIVSFDDHPDVLILDSRLNELQRLDLQAQSEQYCSTAVAMSPYGRLLALSSRTDLRIVHRSGAVLHRIAHHGWESFTGSNCFFDFHDRLWYVRPGDQPGVNDCVTIVEPYSGATLAKQTIKNGIGYFYLFLCPDGESALIEDSCGQDGSYLYLASLTGTALTIQEYPFSDRTFFGGFAPNGREFATGAHNGDSIMVHSFPSGEVIGSVESKTLFATDDLPGENSDVVGYQVIFLDNDHLLAKTEFGRMLLLERRSMRLIGTVWPAGYRLRGHDQSGRETDDPRRIVDYEGSLTTLHPTGRGRVLTAYRDGVLRLLDLWPLLSPRMNPQ